MNIVVWIVSGLLAALYLFVGFAKLSTSKEKLAANPRMAWTDDFSQANIRGIGAAEVAGALGLILPWATGILSVLTPVAAVGLVVIQVGAMITHTRRGEHQPLPANTVLLLLAGFVAIVRFTQL